MSREDMIMKLYHWICDEYVMVMAVRQDELRKLQEMTTRQLKKMYMGELIRRAS